MYKCIILFSFYVYIQKNYKSKSKNTITFKYKKGKIWKIYFEKLMLDQR